MRLLSIILIGFILFGSLKCKQNSSWLERKNTKVQLYAEISNYKDVYRLGDTLKIVVEMPDTVDIFNALNGTTERVFVKELTRAGVGSPLYQVADTLSNRCFSSVNNRSEADIISVYGKTESQVYAFNLSQRPFQCIVYFIPKVIGFYKLSTEYTDTNITINGNIEGVTNVGIKVPDKRLRLMAKYMYKCDSQNTEEEYYQSLIEHESKGGGYYGFFVE
jgi:hypothetical protein